jgi:hypothetical protein
LGRKQLEELGAGELKSPKRLSWRLWVSPPALG